ncbi:MAG: DUF1289 domain-containing protein [Methylovulum sp.]|jgi:predicted Fe-S protein YdhL (DUF1289 family)|nr:DUF1289 domain-containing protein [Methylovulum sp.]TSA39655.1 MAG: DUF1289 domain-containing protein [Methylococcaceae bacterium]
MLTNTQSIDSPCVRKCCLDSNNICVGCFRSLDEIMSWSEASNQERLMYINNAGLRANASNYSSASQYQGAVL